jgi:hypothetical protein
MVEITERKNTDYSSGADPFRNFRIVEAYGLSAEQGFITRMSDKMARLANFIQNGEYKVKDESFLDTCLDLANYSLLLAGYMASKGLRQSPEKPAEDIVFTAKSFTMEQWENRKNPPANQT